MSGAVFYVKQPPQATTPIADVDAMLADFGLGLTAGRTEGTYLTRDDGAYEVRAFGPSGVEGVHMVMRYVFWDIVETMPWPEWHKKQTARISPEDTP